MLENQNYFNIAHFMLIGRYVPSKLAKREYLILSVDVNEESTVNIKPGAIVNAL